MNPALKSNDQLPALGRSERRGLHLQLRLQAHSVEVELGLVGIGLRNLSFHDACEFQRQGRTSTRGVDKSEGVK